MSEFNFDNNVEDEVLKNKKQNTKVDKIKIELEDVRNELEHFKDSDNKSINDEMKVFDLKVKEQELLIEIDRIQFQERNRRRKKSINSLKTKREKLEFKLWKESRENKDSSFSF